MRNFELDNKTIELIDTKTPYHLAKLLINACVLLDEAKGECNHDHQLWCEIDNLLIKSELKEFIVVNREGE